MTAADPAEALARSLAHDAGFAADAGRLAAALADLAPDAVRANRLLVLAADLGVPALLGDGREVEARLRLVDQGGLRPDVARFAVDAWAQALGVGPAPGSPPSPSSSTPSSSPGTPGRAPDGRDGDGGEDADGGEDPGVPTGVRVAVRGDGVRVTALLGTAGVHAAAVTPSAAGPVQWRRVAEPPAPLSRDVAVVLDGDDGRILWSAPGGVFLRRFRVEGRRLLLDDPERFVGSDDAQVRYPLAAWATETEGLQVLWTVDRRTVRLTSWQPWSSQPATRDLALPLDDGERLDALSAAVDARRSVWLAATTDRDRVLAACWDALASEPGAWHDATPRVRVGDVVVAALDAGPTLLAVHPPNHVISCDARLAVRGQVRWRSADRPDGWPGDARALAAAACADSGWLAAVTPEGPLLARMTRLDETVRIEAPVRLSTSPEQGTS